MVIIVIAKHRDARPDICYPCYCHLRYLSATWKCEGGHVTNKVIYIKKTCSWLLEIWLELWQNNTLTTVNSDNYGDAWCISRWKCRFCIRFRHLVVETDHKHSLWLQHSVRNISSKRYIFVNKKQTYTYTACAI